MKTFRVLLMIVTMMGMSFPQYVFAQSPSLQQAQAQGLVGERVDGYIGIIKNAPGVAALVDEINLKRRQLYREIARKNGIPLDAVERLAAEKAIDRAASGEFVQDASGKWIRKP